MVHKCPSAYFSEEEQETLLDELMLLLPGNNSVNLEVVMKVLLPEAIIKIYQDAKNVSYQQAEEELLEGDFPEPEVPVEEVFI